MSNTAKGGLIGGGGGGALGALIGQLAGGGKGAAIGAAIGTTLGAGAGVIIGNKMDKAKKAAEAANAKAEIIEGNDGISYVKATFPSGILLQQEICPQLKRQKRLGYICQGVGQRHGSLHLRIHGQ